MKNQKKKVPKIPRSGVKPTKVHRTIDYNKLYEDFLQYDEVLDYCELCDRVSFHKLLSEKPDMYYCTLCFSEADLP